jgi:long-subunit fatty acid transport protein
MTKNQAAGMATMLSVLSIARAGFAEGGYYSGILGARGTGRGGAVVAKADDLTAVSANPAGIAKSDGQVIELGNIFSYNGYEYARDPVTDPGDIDPQTGQARTSTFDKVKNRKPWQALDPFIGFASGLGRHGLRFALAAYAPPGISSLDFPQAGMGGPRSADGQRYMMVSREAMILKYVGSLAWRYGDVFGIGGTAEWIHVPRLRYSLVIDGSKFPKTANPVSSGYDILASMSGSSAFTFNAVLGAWYRPVPFVELAVSGQVIPTDIVAKSNLQVTPLGSAIGRVNLVRNGDEASDVTVRMPLPMLFRAGARYRHLSAAREVFDVELDLEYETWSRVNQFTIETNGLEAVSQSERVKLGTIAISKAWKDTVAVRLGGDYSVLPGRMTVRAGGYYESAVAEPAYASVDFPSGAQVGGLSRASTLRRRMLASTSKSPGARAPIPTRILTTAAPTILDNPLRPSMRARTVRCLSSSHSTWSFAIKWANEQEAALLDHRRLVPLRARGRAGLGARPASLVGVGRPGAGTLCVHAHAAAEDLPADQRRHHRGAGGCAHPGSLGGLGVGQIVLRRAGRAIGARDHRSRAGRGANALQARCLAGPLDGRGSREFGTGPQGWAHRRGPGRAGRSRPA